MFMPSTNLQPHDNNFEELAKCSEKHLCVLYLSIYSFIYLFIYSFTLNKVDGKYMISLTGSYFRADSRFAPIQWETASLCNESALYFNPWVKFL